jgi:hypothetical protein
LLVDAVDHEHDGRVILEPHEALAADLERRRAVPTILGHLGELLAERAQLLPPHVERPHDSDGSPIVVR